jgi:acetylornithine/succinyldiaminopimelate/putrescine aminotransferase
MGNNKENFLSYLAQTSQSPAAIEIERAEGSFLFGPGGKKYIDLMSGIAVAGSGHRHPKVLEAIKAQLDNYLHVMVYGEFILSPQVKLAKYICSFLPPSLNSVYLVNSGAEAVEGAIKLAKRTTGRSEIISFINSYHGSTHGALSVTGNEDLKRAFRPLLPDVRHIRYNSINDLEYISKRTACVIAEPVQGEAGCIPGEVDFMKALRQKCNETGTLLILDEIQTGLGRTGKLFAFEHYKIVPDILLLAKSFGGGMPLGAFIAPREMMQNLTINPILGHMTTFGGHPVSCAAAHANLQIVSDATLIKSVSEKEALFRKLLQHPSIKGISGKGLLLAVNFFSSEANFRIISSCADKGLLSDWFLFADNCMRIAPPLTIDNETIEEACDIIISCL